MSHDVRNTLQRELKLMLQESLSSANSSSEEFSCSDSDDEMLASQAHVIWRKYRKLCTNFTQQHQKVQRKGNFLTVPEILEFWKKNKGEMPFLADLAMHVCAAEQCAVRASFLEC